MMIDITWCGIKCSFEIKKDGDVFKCDNAFIGSQEMSMYAREYCFQQNKQYFIEKYEREGI